MIHIAGINADTLFKNTRKALEPFNGSPVKKDAKVRQFLAAQLGLRNEHVYPSVFTDAAPQPVSHQDDYPPSHESVAQLFSAIEGATLDLHDEIHAYQALLRHFIARTTDDGLKTALNDAFDLEQTTDAEDSLLTESRAVHDFYDMIHVERCRDCYSKVEAYFCTNKHCTRHHYTQDVDPDLLNYTPNEIPSYKKRHAITLSVETDDGQLTGNFDASPFFYFALENGSLDSCMEQLTAFGLDCCMPVDSIFEFIADRDTQADEILSYCLALHHQDKEGGYQASLNEEELNAFLATYNNLLGHAE